MRKSHVNCFIIVMFVAAMLTLMSCSSSDGGGDSGLYGSPTTATGKFVDAPVAGMTYVSGGQMGVTDSNGAFTYEVGNTVTFSAGGVVLGTVSGQPVVTPVNLAAQGSTSATPEVVARVQFLMSVSSTDPTSGVITITPALLAAAATKAINWTSATIQADLATLISALAPAATLVTPAAAQAHLTSNINSLFLGIYTGTYTGTGTNNTGTWSMTIDSNGNVTGSSNSTGNITSATITGAMTTQVSSGTKYVFTGTAGSDATWTGTLDVTTRILSGTWSSLTTGNSGTFTTL